MRRRILPLLVNLIIFHLIRRDAAIRDPFWHKSYNDNCVDMQIDITIAMQRNNCSFLLEKFTCFAYIDT